MVEVAVCRCGQLQCAEADIIQGLVIKSEALVGILDKLVDGKGSVIRLNYGVGHLGGRDHGECTHDSVGVLLTNLRDQKCAHS